MSRALEIPNNSPAVVVATQLDQSDLDFLQDRAKQLRQAAQMQTSRPHGTPSIEYLLRLLVKQYRQEARY